MRRFALLAALLGLAGCATPATSYTVAPPDAVAAEAAQQEEMVRTGGRWQQQAPDSFSAGFHPAQRLTAVAERVLIAAAPYCQGRLMNAYAINVGSRDNGPPQVINAAPPLRPGDRVLALNGRAVPGGAQGYVFLGREGGAHTRTGQPLYLLAQRGRERLEAEYTVVPACAFNINLEDNNEWNAYADGETIHVERRLLQDVRNDDDLAFVIAHELAHNILGHVGKSQQNAMAGALVGLGLEAVISGMGGGGMGGELARAGAGMGQMTYSQEFEREADYVGLYILANSGYDLYAGPRVARRIAGQDPRSIHYAGSHPGSAERAAALLATIGEIERKMKAGQPLVPNPAPRRS